MHEFKKFAVSSLQPQADRFTSYRLETRLRTINKKTDSMDFREATTEDIKKLHSIRLAVKENVLSNPLLVTETDYINFLTLNGKGWLCEVNDEIVGFAIIDTTQNNIWALFVKPEFEKKGIGKSLHDTMLNWFFNQSENKLWLTTAPNTRAENFYKASGWIEIGKKENGELKFEMTSDRWRARTRIQD